MQNKKKIALFPDLCLRIFALQALGSEAIRQAHLLNSKAALLDTEITGPAANP